MSVLVVTGTDTGVGKTVATAALACHARLAGIDVAVCKPVQTGIRGRRRRSRRGRADCPGVTELHGLGKASRAVGARWRPRQRAGVALPTRSELRFDWSPRSDRPGRLTLVEGAGGLLVEIGADGVTLRDLAVDLAAPVLVVVGPGLGTLNHTALTLEALACTTCSVRRSGDRCVAGEPGVAEAGNRDALAPLAPLRAVLPDGRRVACQAAEFESMSASAFDAQWVESLVG